MIYKTDKIKDLLKEYENIFKDIRNEELNILEIGVQRGYSLKWAEDYFPKAKITGIDIDISQAEIKGDRTTLLEISQNDTAKLEEVAKGGFDIIIDDGSHFKKETQNTFDVFWKSTKYYIIEDWDAGINIPGFLAGQGLEDVVFNAIKNKTSLGIEKASVYMNRKSYAFFKKKFTCKESALAHKYLDKLVGYEIGGSAFNKFNLPNCLNVDYTDDMDTMYKRNEYKMCKEKMPVDIVASGDCLPFETGSVDYIINSHVIEHFYNPIKALNEWHRVVKDGGFIFIICPHKERIFDKNRPITTLNELLIRDASGIDEKNYDKHWNVWDTKTFKELLNYLKFTIVEELDVDDKLGNGFCFILRK